MPSMDEPSTMEKAIERGALAPRMDIHFERRGAKHSHRGYLKFFRRWCLSMDEPLTTKPLAEVRQSYAKMSTLNEEV